MDSQIENMIQKKTKKNVDNMNKDKNPSLTFCVLKGKLYPSHSTPPQQMFASSLLFGYFLRHTYKRFALARSLGMLPGDQRQDIAVLEALYEKSVFPLPPASPGITYFLRFFSPSKNSKYPPPPQLSKLLTGKRPAQGFLWGEGHVWTDPFFFAWL